MKKAFGIQKKSSRKAVAIFATLLVIVGSVAGMLNVMRNNQPANATLAGFQAGNIISDYVMGNKGTMSIAQIQNFLNSKGQCNMAVGSGSSAGAIKDSATQAHYTFYSARLGKNITYYYHITNGNFVCLSQETFGSDGLPATGGQTAAQIIYDVAQQYSINPQVLIVLLQKESSLITDSWPNYASSDETNYPAEYKVAAGYGCPDSSVCSSQYYGLTNQLSNAANLFRTVLNGGWSTYPAYQTKYIQYNPDPNCGGSNVYISNYATSALYRYTPYQPNAGALAAGTGTATCGAYGNRNFYNFFTDWFGDTHDIGHGPFTGKLASLGSSITAIGSYTTDWEKVQHVISLKSDGSIYETYWGNGITPTTGKLASVEDTKLINGYSDKEKYQHVISLKNNGDIYETWWW